MTEIQKEVINRAAYGLTLKTLRQEKHPVKKCDSRVRKHIINSPTEGPGHSVCKRHPSTRWFLPPPALCSFWSIRPSLHSANFVHTLTLSLSFSLCTTTSMSIYIYVYIYIGVCVFNSDLLLLSFSSGSTVSVEPLCFLVCASAFL